MDDPHQGLIVQHVIRFPHPGLLEIADGFRNEGIAEVPLAAARINHGRLSAASGLRPARGVARNRMRIKVRLLTLHIN
jgi:hypothetical protein